MRALLAIILAMCCACSPVITPGLATPTTTSINSANHTPAPTQRADEITASTSVPTCTVIVESANLRSAPRTTDVVTWLNRGDQLNKDDKQSSTYWFKVSSEFYEGYIASYLVECK
jgi:hypothetical protein